MERTGGQKKRKKGPKVRQKTRTSDEVLDEEPHEFEIPGVNKLLLSPVAQEAIGCIIGEDITPESPWISIPKYKFQDAMELPEEGTMFLPLEHQINTYPEEEILLGYDPSEENIKEQVFVCVTVDAKHAILDLVKKQKEETYEKLKASLVKQPREWQSLGSEKEVEDEQVKNFRPLIEVEVNSKFPLYETGTKFSVRRPEDTRDGYIELLSTRETFSYVTRKRVDAGTQASPTVQTNEAQTNPAYPQSKWTQYSFAYEERDLNKPMTKEITKGIVERADSLCEEIRVNEHINFHSYDYSRLDRPMFRPLQMDIPQQLIFQDVEYCKGKKVSSIAWHPTISGLLLASYMNKHPHMSVHAECKRDRVQDVVHSEKLVLLWCYEDSLQPKLYLECHREVTYITFCERNPNIVVGGCENGQVLIWDITGRLEAIESKEILSNSEQKHRNAMESMVGWMKKTRGAAWVQPTVVSAAAYSHSQAITDIFWMSPTSAITRNGKVVEVLSGNSLQFLTAGLDGLVHVWDLNSTPLPNKHGPIKRSGRLKVRPSALTLNVSWLKPLDKVFVPQFRLIVEDKRRVPITHFSIKKAVYNYSPFNSETQHLLYERTYFQQTSCDVPGSFEPEIIVASSSGQLLKVRWEGNDFDQGQVVNSEVCSIQSYLSFHDGPIRSCTRSPVYGHVLLTVGGKMFMLWTLNDFRPVLWRSANVEYVSGVWSSVLLNIILLNRIDGYLEMWNSDKSTTRPAIVVHLTSNLILDLVTDNQKFHTRKNTVAMTDKTGAIHILSAPNLWQCYMNIKMDHIMNALRERGRRRQKLHLWMKTWIETHQANEKVNVSDVTHEQEGHEQNNSKELKQLNKDEMDEQLDTFDKILTEKWETAQERDMYRTLLKRKKLNLKEISLKSKPLRLERQKKRMFQIKEAQKLADKEKIFEKAKASLFRDAILRPREQIKLDDIEENDLCAIKKSYVSDFYEMIRNTPNTLTKKHFHMFVCAWNQILGMAKERKKSTVTSRKVNLHYKRYQQEVDLQEEEMRKTFIVDTASRISTFTSESEVDTIKSETS